MGWNSWDSYGTTVTEAEVLANARFMAEHLLSHGWDTVVVDIDWADPNARAHGYNDDATLTIDAHGRLQPDPVRFPSSAGGAGFGPLAAQIHAMGLRFGIHIMRGIPCVSVGVFPAGPRKALAGRAVLWHTNRESVYPHPFIGSGGDGDVAAAPSDESRIP